MTTNQLESRINFLNKIAPSEKGEFQLSQSYGGNALVFVNNDTGQKDMLNTGHISKAKLYSHINAFIDGLQWVEYNN